MILAPNVNVQLVDPDTGMATSFFSKFLGSVVAQFGTSANQPWSPGAIGSGALVSVSVPVLNAASGQPAGAAHSSMTAGIIPLAFVEKAGSVKAFLWNTTGATVTPVAGTVTVFVWKP